MKQAYETNQHTLEKESAKIVLTTACGALELAEQ